MIEWTAMASAAVSMLAGFDLATRRCPNWLSLPILAAGIVWYGAEALWPSVMIGGIMTLAQFPSGDIKGATAMAAWVPLTVMIVGLCLTLMVTLVLMETQWYKLYQRAHRWPWLAGLGVSLTVVAGCRILLIG